MYLLLSIVSFLAAPTIYVLRAKALIRPQTVEQAERTVVRVRSVATVFNLIGAVLLAVYVIDVATIRVEAVARFVVSVLGSVLLMKVVAADFVLWILTEEFKHRDDARTRENMTQMNAVFETLTTIEHHRTPSG